jgi:hypothetical protein
MSARKLDRAVLALWLALALPIAANAGDLYRWVTPDGRVEIGPFPPRGVHAEPWKPEETSPPAATPPPATPPPSAPAAAEPSGAPRVYRTLNGLNARPSDQGPTPCEQRRQKAAKLASERQQTEREIDRLEATIARLEETLVAHEDSSCLSDANGDVSRGCSGGSFDRDAELEKSRRKLDRAQSKLGDLEQRERETASGDDCPSAPAAPAP